MIKIQDNIILSTDAYKQTHWLQYPKGTEYVYSYFESRGGEFSHTAFFGLQILLKKYLEGVVVNQGMIEEAEYFCNKLFFGQKYFNREGWEYIIKEYGGKLPVRIKAVPEGTVVPVSNILMSIENTDPKVPFITNLLETLLVQVWYPTTVCTTSYFTKLLIDKYAKITGTSVNPFHLNDFGFRGASSKESAGIGGAAHLVNFNGTDTLEGIRYAMQYYNSYVCGYSVMAAEHSTITAFCKENETESYRHILEVAPDNAIVSIVSDSYDIYNTVDNIFGKELKDKIRARKGKWVVRPDSGDPAEVIVKVLRSLRQNFGATTNSDGFFTLSPKVGVIYGDGINYGNGSIERILKAVVEAKFSLDNVIFGMGGGLLQDLNRDTCKFAFKCAEITVDGEVRDVYKKPVTSKMKISKKGRQKLTRDRWGVFRTMHDDPSIRHFPDHLKTVFYNGEILKEYTFDEVKENIAKFPIMVDKLSEDR